MASNTPAAAASSSSGANALPSEDSLDVGALLSPLQREEVEFMLVKLLARHPEEAPWVIAAARKPVDTLEISTDVSTLVNTGTSLLGICDEFESYVTRSTDYLNTGHVRNSVAVLEAITKPATFWAAEQGDLDDLEADEKQGIENLFALLENAWQSVINNCELVDAPEGSKPLGVAVKTELTKSSGTEKADKARAGKRGIRQLARNELDFHAALLTDAKKKLTPTIGPMFSDPLRALNKKKAEKAATAASAPASSSSAAASSTTPEKGTKRKLEADASSAEPREAKTEQTGASTTEESASAKKAKK